MPPVVAPPPAGPTARAAAPLSPVRRAPGRPASRRSPGPPPRPSTALRLGAGAFGDPARVLAPAVLVLLIALYALTAGAVALRRHHDLGSQALDMGYADQVAWNALHGHGLRFTVFRGDVGAEDGHPLRFGPGADRDSLFAYHVELLFLPLSLLYLLHAGPDTLIVLLTGVLALGALPVYAIALRQLGHRGAALCFAALYLLFPAVQAANLADFHAVSLSATTLLVAWYALLAGRDRLFVLAGAVSAAAKEEVGLLVGLLGLYAWLARGRRRLGPATAALGFGWAALCFLVIIPHFSGGAPSLFATRYADAVHRIGGFPAELLAGRPALPLPDYTIRYLFHLLAGTGFLALGGPLGLALAAPALAINGLSGSAWQHGGGAHYSAEAVPALIVAAIWGTDRLARGAARQWGWAAPRTGAAVAGAGLAVSLLHGWPVGALPPGARFAWPDAALSSHAAHLGPLLARIPPEAAVSAQSDVYPHLSARERIYVFPTIDDATYVLVDVAGTSDPLDPDDLAAAAGVLLADPRFDLLAADDGFLLFRRRGVGTAPAGGGGSDGARAPEPRGGGGSPGAGLPPAFTTFARAAPGERFAPVQATLGDLFDVAGFRADPLPELNFAVQRARPTVYLRARRPIQGAYRFTPFIVTREGAPWVFDRGNATQLWYPTDEWPAGAVLRIQLPPLTYGPGDRLGIGAQTGAGPEIRRLPARGGDAPPADGGRVAVLGALP